MYISTVAAKMYPTRYLLDYNNKRETDSVWNNAVWDEIKFKSSIANIAEMTTGYIIKKHKPGSLQQKQ